jgi:hypothetical protein
MDGVMKFPPWIPPAVLVAVLHGSVGAEPGVKLRVDAGGFDSSAADIAAVCNSVAECLVDGWERPPADKVLVVRGEHGPFTAFARNERGEAVIRLDTGGTYWCQYAYQFAHELCHLLGGCEDDFRGNLWFEETLCEAASLYCMRRMSERWRTSPPYPNWRDFAPSLADYARDVIVGRDHYDELLELGLPAYYRRHRQRLEAEPCDRAINGAMAVALLGLFECEPERWEAIRWLNSSPSPDGETFRAYLRKWHDAAGADHRPFIRRLAGLFGVGW